jgi:HEAT repeat protein
MTSSPERPSESAQARLALRALDELVRAAHQCSLYGMRHPVAQQACAAAAEAFVAMMAERPEFTLTVTESGLRAEGDELKDHPPLRQLHENLRRRQIASLTVRPGLTAEEVMVLIEVLATDAADLAHLGGPGSALMRADCEHVELNDVDYSRFVPEAQARWLSALAGGQTHISSSVQGLVDVCLAIPGDRLRIADKKSTFDHGIPMPFPVPIVDAPSAEDEEAQADAPPLHEQVAALHEVSPDDYVAVGLAWLVQASGEAMLDAPAITRKAWRETVAQRIGELELPLQARIFRAPRQGAADAPDMLAAIVADRTPEQIADLIVARPAAAVGEPSGALERILRRALTDERKLVAVEPLLRERLMARGMSQDSFRNVVGLLLDQIATDMAMRVGGVVEWLGDFEDLPPSESGTIEQWPDLLKTVSPATVTQARARVLLNMLPYDHDAARYLDLVNQLEQCALERAAAKDPGLLDIVTALAKEVEHGDSTRTPIASAGLQRIATEAVAQVMRAALGRTPLEQRAELIVMIGEMGNACTDILLDEAENTDLDPQVRSLAVRCLADAGERGAAEVRHLLAQAPFDRVMFAAAALIEGRDQRFLKLLAAGFDHRQAAVRMRLAEWLGRVRGLVSEQLLIRALYDEDPGVQAKAAESLGEMKASGAVHALSLAAKRGPLHRRALEVRKSAIQALGKIGSPDAVPTLKEIMRKRSLVFRERAQELSSLAAAALARMGCVEAQQALAEWTNRDGPRAPASEAAAPRPLATRRSR